MTTDEYFIKTPEKWIHKVERFEANILNPNQYNPAMRRLVKAITQSAEWQSDQYRADTFAPYIAKKTK